MSVKKALSRGPIVPLPPVNPVGSEELAGGRVVFADHEHEGQWFVIDDQHVYDLDAIE